TIADGAAAGTSLAISSPSTRGWSLATGATGATFVLNAGWTIAGPITGPGNFSLGGNGFSGTSQILTVSNTGNAWGGFTKINQGTLSASGGSAIPDTSAVTLANAANIGFTVTPGAATTETVGNLSGGGTTGGVITITGST